MLNLLLSYFLPSNLAESTELLRQALFERQRSITDIENRLAEAQVNHKDNMEREKLEHASLKAELERETLLSHVIRDKLRSYDRRVGELQHSNYLHQNSCR